MMVRYRSEQSLRFVALVLLTSSAFYVSASANAQTTTELMEKAAYQETVVGDLEAAKKLYREILRLHPANRVIAENARMRLKTIDLKLTQTETSEGTRDRDNTETPNAIENTDLGDLGRLPVDLVETLKIIRNQYIDDVGDKTVLTESALKGLVTELDLYSSFVSANQLENLYRNVRGDIIGIGVVLHGIEGEIVVRETILNSPAFEAGLLPGDKIVAIDGQHHEKVNEDVRMMKFVNLIRGQSGQSVRLTIERDGADAPLQFKIFRHKVEIPSVLGIAKTDPNTPGRWHYRLPGKDDVGYLKIGSFTKRTPSEIREVVSQLQTENIAKLIVDLRDCSGGLLQSSVESADLFLNAGEVVRVEGRETPVVRHLSKAGQLIKGVPIAVLVSERTASAAELFAAAMQDRKRAVIVGQRTFGKASVQALFPLPSGGAIKLTTARFVRPSGKQLDKSAGAGPDDEWGVIPDVRLDAKKRVIHFESEDGILLNVERIRLQDARVIVPKEPENSDDEVLQKAIESLEPDATAPHRTE